MWLGQHLSIIYFKVLGFKWIKIKNQKTIVKTQLQHKTKLGWPHTWVEPTTTTPHKLYLGRRMRGKRRHRRQAQLLRPVKEEGSYWEEPYSQTDFMG